MSYVNEKLLADIERVGWHVLGIDGDATTPNVAHTVGLVESFGHPEIVCIGLKTPVLMEIVSNLGRRAAAGTQLEPGDEPDGVVKGHRVRMGRVLPVAHERFLPGATEFYGDRDFAALQCLWPDEKGLFPSDRDVDGQCATVQPDLGDPEWAEIYAGWGFEESYVLVSYTTRFVLDGSRPILRVTHDGDGDWQFLCGTTVAPKDGRLIALKSAVKLDPTVSELADLPPGWSAVRIAPGSPWTREESPDDEDDDG